VDVTERALTRATEKKKKKKEAKAGSSA